MPALACIPEEDVNYCARNMCLFSHIFKKKPGTDVLSAKINVARTVSRLQYMDKKNIMKINCWCMFLFTPLLSFHLSFQYDFEPAELKNSIKVLVRVCINLLEAQQHQCKPKRPEPPQPEDIWGATTPSEKKKCGTAFACFTGCCVFRSMAFTKPVSSVFFFCLSVCPTICLSWCHCVCLSFCLCVSLRLCVCLSHCLFLFLCSLICLSICLVFPSVYLSVAVRPSVHSLIGLSVCPVFLSCHVLNVDDMNFTGNATCFLKQFVINNTVANEKNAWPLYFILCFRNALDQWDAHFYYGLFQKRMWINTFNELRTFNL